LIRSFHHSHFARAVLEGRRATVSVCVPTLDEAGSIAQTLAPLIELREARLLDQVAVVDSGSTDGTQAIVEGSGVELYDARELLSGAGPVIGKGDALWRALTVLHGEIICFVDADSEDFGEHFVTGLCGPLLAEPRLWFVKGAYARPFKLGGTRLVEGGGRVTELTARPLLNAFYPELAVFRQPLAGEIAARRGLLLELPFDTGYALETGMLIDVWSSGGLSPMAEVDLGTRQNRHRALADLTPMAAAVLQAVMTRLRSEGRLTGDADVRVARRPPLASLGLEELYPGSQARIQYG
jgi:glucosyl-3-phosphoglycerate synthase